MKLRLMLLTAAAAIMMLFAGGNAHADDLCARVILPSVSPVVCAPLP